MSNYVLELKNISKSFPGVKAVDNVSLNLKEGEVLGLVGENGAGKSTLIKIITGVFRPDEGELFLHGKKVHFYTSRHAIIHGISAVHQERNLIPTFNVAENIMFEKITDKSFSIIRMKKVVKEAEKYLRLVNLDVSPFTNVEDLSTAQKQILEIARALSLDAKIVMLDEPSASISIKDVELLLETIRGLKKKGYSFIYVSHKLDEIFRICDRVCVIRDGKNAGEICSIDQLDNEKLIRMMVGRSSNKHQFEVRRLNEEVILEACNIASKNRPVPNSFKLYKGEILGWYGLVGAGRTELAREIIGIDPIRVGSLRIDGFDKKIRNVEDAISSAHIAYASESRNEEGLFLIHSIKTNISSSIWKMISSKFGFVNLRKEKEYALKFKNKLEIKAPNIGQIVNYLSGGNRQKVSIGKVLAANPKILIIDEPTVGIDIMTKGEIHKMIWDLSITGISIILISSDMTEVISLADRILVFSGGSICSEIYNNKDYDEISNKIMNAIVSCPIKEGIA